jgi:hypothetical protein
MKKLPAAVFSVLAAATVAAFFFTQHLKVSTPLVTGIWTPTPGTLNPVSGPACDGVPARHTRISFYLQNRSDYVDVNIVNEAGEPVRTLASGRYLRAHPAVRAYFYWDGRIGGRPAPQGTYFVAVTLHNQSRTVELSNEAGPLPIKIQTSLPEPGVDSVRPQLIPRPGGTMNVTVRVHGNGLRSGTVLLYRTDLPGDPRLVKYFSTQWGASQAVWDGKIHQLPAPAGTYLVGFQVTDAACNTARFPARLPPAPGSTPHAGVSVRYLAAAPPPVPVPPGSHAAVGIEAIAPYAWTLSAAGGGRLLASGSASVGTSVSVPLPPGPSGLYQLTVRSGAHVTAVPVVSDSPAPAPLLVVLPSLTWQGLNPVDQTGDGLPDTLPAGGPVALTRPYANGMPAGVLDEAALVAYLGEARRRYQLTTDVALAGSLGPSLTESVGPSLTGHRVVVLAGSERWVPPSLAAALRAYVLGGGHVVSLGIDSLRRFVTLRAGLALHPRAPEAIDVLGARPAPLATNPGPVSVLADPLGIFKGLRGSLPGFGRYQPLQPPAGHAASQAGSDSHRVAVTGYRLGRGVVVDIGLPGFGSALAVEPAARGLLGSVLSALSR